MSATGTGARQRQDVLVRSRCETPVSRHQIVNPSQTGHSSKPADFSLVKLGPAERLSFMLAPASRGSFREQLEEVLGWQQDILQAQSTEKIVTSQTIFLRDAADQAQCEKLLALRFEVNPPVTTFVLQPPCCGAAMALEAWALGGPSIHVERFAPQLMAVGYDGIRWVYCGSIHSRNPAAPVHEQTIDALEQLRRNLARARCNFESVVRTWFYLGSITGVDGRKQRYKELNRARTDFYKSISFYPSLLRDGNHARAYPASTGIGMGGTGLVLGCTAFETERKDVFLLPLENPRQTPAYDYHSRYSPQSPKFSRAMALVFPRHVTTWISGTASIVNSESKHTGDIKKQTEQTIDNIEGLIASDNFRSHGVTGAGAGLHDLAKLRVYIKRQEDYAKCRAVCERRFGAVPAIYAIADVCRPELLVEIEGVAFSARDNRKATSSVKPDGEGSAPPTGK